MDLPALRAEIEADLLQNVLPFWRAHGIDRETGGITCGLDNQLRPVEASRSLVLCARMLWTFSVAAQRYGNPEDRAVADHAYRDLVEHFWDPEFGGFYWSLEPNGQIRSDQKATYAQAFAMYGLAEYSRLTGDPKVLELARTTFRYIEEKLYEPVYGGYIEALDRQGVHRQTSALHTGGPEIKTHNTQLHMLEALSALRLADPANRALSEAHSRQLKHTAASILHPATGHFAETTHPDWTPASDTVSFGHDIEACWLLHEADHIRRDMEDIGSDVLRETVDSVARSVATRVRENGLLENGLLSSHIFSAPSDTGWFAWWAQAEAVVGFLDAYQATGDTAFAEASINTWKAISTMFIDRENGDWFKEVDHLGRVNDKALKVGPWECPYHHARMAFEVTSRIPA